MSSSCLDDIEIELTETSRFDITLGSRTNISIQLWNLSVCGFINMRIQLDERRQTFTDTELLIQAELPRARQTRLGRICGPEKGYDRRVLEANA